MKIIRSNVMGFCSGVQNAIVRVNEAIELGKRQDLPIYTIGPLIHNDKYLAYLESLGVKIVESPEDERPGIAVIRAHGIPQKMRALFAEKGYQLLDGTCPRVIRSQRIVSTCSERGETIVLVGDPGHGEVAAVAGAAEGLGKVIIIHDEKDLSVVPYDKHITILSQTTFSKDRFASITDTLQELIDLNGGSLEIIQSICPSTKNRQQALQELCESVDAIIVVGGKNSSNTKRLYELALSCCGNVWHINSPEEVTSQMCHHRMVGITAGASTPDWLIVSIEERLQSLSTE